MKELALAFGGIALMAFIMALLCWEQIAILLVVREIRKQAAMLPEDRREVYLREGLKALDRAAEAGERRGERE